MCVIVHGDAALSGQGINQEALMISYLPHFHVGAETRGSYINDKIDKCLHTYCRVIVVIGSLIKAANYFVSLLNKTCQEKMTDVKPPVTINPPNDDSVKYV